MRLVRFKLPLVAVLRDDRGCLSVYTSAAVSRSFEVVLKPLSSSKDHHIEFQSIRRAVEGLPVSGVYLQFVLHTFSGDYGVKEAVGRFAGKDSLQMLAYDVEGVLQRRLYLTVVSTLPKEGKLEERVKERNHSLEVTVDAVVEALQSTGYDVRMMDDRALFEAVYRGLNPLVCDSTLTAVPQAGCWHHADMQNGLVSSDIVVGDYSLTTDAGRIMVAVVEIFPEEFEDVCRPLSEIPFSFVYNFTMFIPDQDGVIRELESARFQARLFRGKSLYGTANRVKFEQIEKFFRDRKTAEGYKIVKIFVSLLIWGRTEDEVQQKAVALRGIFSRYNLGIYFEYMKIADGFAASQIGCASSAYEMNIATIGYASKFMPLRNSATGVVDEDPVCVFKTRQNSVYVFSPFSSKQNRWSTVVIGPPGYGKTNFVNRVIFNSLLYNPVIAIFDMATEPGYESLVETTGGTHFNVSVSDRFRVNMFDLRVGESKPVGSKRDSLEAVISRMISSEGDIPKEYRSVINRAIERVYQICMEESPRNAVAVTENEELYEFVRGGAPSFTYWLEYRDYYLEQFLSSARSGQYRPDFLLKAEMAQNFATPTLGDFVRVLASDRAVRISEIDREVADAIQRKIDQYVVGDISSVFNGITEFYVDVGEKAEIPLYSFFLGRITDPSVLSLLLLIYRDFFFRKAVFLSGEIPWWLNDLPELRQQLMGRFKIMIYDEFHNLKDDAFLMRVLDRDSRQSRTLGMAQYYITHKIEDIKKHGYALLTGASNKVFTRMAPDDIRPAVEAIDGTDFDVKNIEMLEFRAGKYADYYLIQEGIGRAVVRASMNPVFRWLSTTHHKERSFRDSIADYLESKTGRSKTEVRNSLIGVLCEVVADGLIGIPQDRVAELSEKVKEIALARVEGKG